MRLHALVSATVCAAALLGAAPGRAGGLPHVTLKAGPDRAAAPGARVLAVPFDCPAADTITVWAACDTVLAGDTTGAPSLVDGYACAPWNEPGGEVFFALDLRTDVRLAASLQNYEADLDIFLLSGCDGEACLAGENAALGLELAAGFYWLVVDGWEGEEGGEVQSGPFEVRLECRFPGLPQAACDGAFPVAVHDGLAFADTRSLYEQPNLMLLDESCSPYFVEAGEVWYALSMPPHSEVTVDVTMNFLDAALWLFDGCPAGSCLDHADEELSGGTESLTYRNASGDERTVYLGVDALRPPSGEGDLVLKGQYDLSIGGVLPARRGSLGGLKGRYR